jgi:hypothetical protein
MASRVSPIVFMQEVFSSACIGITVVSAGSQGGFSDGVTGEDGVSVSTSSSTQLLKFQTKMCC